MVHKRGGLDQKEFKEEGFSRPMCVFVWKG